MEITEAMGIFQNWIYQNQPILCTDGIVLPSISLERARNFSESKTISAKFRGKEMVLLKNGTPDLLAIKYCRRFSK